MYLLNMFYNIGTSRFTAFAHVFHH